MMEKIQYAGDKNDMQQLRVEYNIDGYISTRTAQEKEKDNGLKNSLMKDGVLLNKTLSPRIFNIIEKVLDTISFKDSFDIFCIRSNEINAFAHITESEQGSERIIALTSSALELLSDTEIAFIIGHELGHYIYQHNSFLQLLNHNEENERLTVLPYLGECLFMKWRKKSELSADRIGIIASGSFEDSASALLKSGYGLSGKNLNLNIEVLMEQLESIKNKPEIVEAAFSSHPLLPLRLKALQLFHNYQNSKNQDIKKIDLEIASYFSWFKRYPNKPLHKAVMQVIALVGMDLLGVDQEMNDEEIKILLYILHLNFTDEPEKELIFNSEKRKAAIIEAIGTVNELGEEYDSHFIIKKLAEIAMADGKLINEEAGMILSIAEILDISARNAYAIIVNVIQKVGFKVDFRMEGLVKDVKKQFAQISDMDLMQKPSQ